MKTVQLGDKVKDAVTGFTGIAVGRSEWLNGCVRIAVQSDKLKDGLPTESHWIDEPQLSVIKAGVVSAQRAPNGGPRPDPKRAIDPKA